jgi:hypothetical protein
MINFGQPRVGDAAWAKFVGPKTVGSYRVTHWKDIVPHSPGEFLGFEHHTTEEFENDQHVLKTCSSTNGEDPTCAD